MQAEQASHFSAILSIATKSQSRKIKWHKKRRAEKKHGILIFAIVIDYSLALDFLEVFAVALARSIDLPTASANSP